MAQIKKDTSLRKAILQAAITGQLISTCHSELDSESAETGKELLDKIIEERNKKLLADWEEKQTDLFASNDTHSKNAKTVRSEQIRLSKKIKKPEPIVASEIEEDEIPFEIPENWCWCRLGDIISLLSGQDFPPEKYSDVDESTPYITGASNIENNHVIINRWTKYPSVISKKEDILLVCKGSGYGNVVIADFDEAHIARQFMAIRTSNLTLRDWIFLYLQNKFSYFKTQGNGLIPGIARNVVLDLLIPLPPLAVQNAIVAKLDQVLPLVDAYENALLQKEELKNALFDKVKKAILQEAITGHLTEAWRKSATIKESGKQRLDRIIEERNAKALAEWEEALKKNPKAKKPMPVVASEIEEDEIPFEVPKSWCWCRLGDICYKIGDIDHKMPKDVIDGIPYISPKDFTEDNIDFLNAKKISQEDFDDLSKKMKPQKGDIIFPRYGTIGIVRLVNVDFNFLVSYSCCTISTMKNLVSEYYIFYMLQSAHIKDEIDKYINKTTQPNVGLESIKHFLIPLPPIEEQKHIVEKIEQLLSLCGELK